MIKPTRPTQPKTDASGSHIGDNTHNQDHVITPVNFKAMNNIVNILPNDGGMVKTILLLFMSILS